MATMLTLGVLIVINFILCSFISFLFRKRRTVDWGIAFAFSFVISLFSIWLLDG